MKAPTIFGTCCARTLGGLVSRRCDLKVLKLGLAAGALLVASAFTAKADGIDPVLKMGGGGGSPNCVSNGVSYQATTSSTGEITSSNGMCVNNTGSVITSFSFEILASNAPGGITPELDCLLAPFAEGCPNADPEDTNLDWTVSCTNLSGIIDCTASRSTQIQGHCSNFLSPQQCQNGPNSSPDKCTNSFFYVFFGILQGCDISVGTVPGGGTFAPNSLFDIVPEGTSPAALVPEPGSLAMMLVGLGGLPLLRRRFVRS